MRFTSCELVGFKRMQLNAVESFSIKPTAPVQLILGTNGSGKSSLIGELTPLPANPADYFKDGSKTIRITDRNNNYVLNSKFAPKNEHSFIKNGTELNPGGTGSAQKELVKQEFRITPEIHELVTGQEVFTNMSPSRRREWFTNLSDINYDYALGVYNKLRERARDISGALKLASKRLVAESSKTISDEEETKLRKDIREISDELHLLQSNRAPLDRPIAEYERDLYSGLDELSRMSSRLLRMRFIAPYGIHPRQPIVRDDWHEIQRPGFTCVEDIDVLLDEFKQDIATKEALINKAVTDHGKIKETVRILMRTGEEGIKALMTRRTALVEKRNNFLSQRKLGIEGVDPHNALNALESIYDLLSATFNMLPENEDRRFSQPRLQELQGLILQAKDERSRLQTDASRFNSQKEHMEAHKTNGDTECPKCQHRWNRGYDERRFNELVQVLAKHDELIAELTKKIAKLEEEMEANQSYGELYRDYMRCARNWPVLTPLWDHLMENGYVTRSPRKALSVVDTFRHDLGFETEARKVNDEIFELEDLIRSSEQVGDANLSEMKLKLDEVTFAIEELTSELGKTQNNLSEYTQYKRQLTEAIELGNRIIELRDNVTQINADMIEMIRRDTLNHCISQLQHSLVRKEQTLSQVTLQKGIIADLEKQIEQLKIEDEAAKGLVKQLSPTDGLIAEGLMGFIRTFTTQMNSLIRKIWAYPLQIQDCGVSGEAGAELDYKFPMMVQTKSNIVADVSKGSSGMKEIVNLAFKVTAMHYLGLAESPLYLDEFGASFDEAHRSSAMQVVKTLLDQQPFTQLWMVSHYESSYGSMTNAEICVICPNNITVPTEQKYNQHVIIK